MARSRKPAGTPRTKRGPGPRPSSDGIPWPTYADGQPYAIHLPVRLEGDDVEGKVQWTEWAHPDGKHMEADQRVMVRNATKTLPERRTTRDGAWFAIVTWPGSPPTRPSRVLMSKLVPLPVPTCDREPTCNRSPEHPGKCWDQPPWET